jgi:DNA invertase Pin-like site-specific DNA recombinase
VVYQSESAFRTVLGEAPPPLEMPPLSESLDTATPAGRMVFTVLGAVAELERSLIAERVRAGLRNARAKGKRLGRPRMIMDRATITRFR